MKHFFYSHQNALEEVPSGERADVEFAIAGCAIPLKRGSGPKIREQIVRALGQRGWSGEFQVAPPSKITIASVKSRVGLCIQTGGNMSRMYADLLKLQKLFVEDQIVAGAFVLPTALAARQLGDNVANADRLKTELTIFRKVISMPIALFSFE